MRPVLAALLALAALAPSAVASADCVDPRLSEAAAGLMVATREPDPRSLVDAARVSGSNAVALRMLRAASGSTGLTELSDAAAAEHGPLLVCGEAELDGSVLRIVGREGARLSVALTEAGVTVDVELRQTTGSPTLEVRAADGTAFRRAVDRPRARIPLPDGFPETFVAQIVAAGATGPRPIATISHGAQPLGEAVDDDIHVHVARLRREARVAELRMNQILNRVAAAHAATVCRDGRATHVTSEGDPVARVRRAGLEARAIGEVVSRAGDVRAAIVGLDTSPSHRLELEDGSYTDYGAGTAESEDGHVCVVVELAAWPRFSGGH